MRKHDYFVFWLETKDSVTRVGNSLISTRLKGNILFHYIVEEVRKEVPNAVIMNIQRLD